MLIITPATTILNQKFNNPKLSTISTKKYSKEKKALASGQLLVIHFLF
jgi:hypothetical protein